MTLRRSFSTVAITRVLTAAAGCAADPGVGPTLSGDENPLAVTFIAQVDQTTSRRRCTTAPSAATPTDACGSRASKGVR
jgi:hypothetical protein